jgi:hypothetical protein
MTGFRRAAARERHPLDPDSYGAEPLERACEWPGCEREGRYRAPRSRERLRDWQWFCLDHVREYNLGWDYFRGMSPDQIDAHRRGDTTWHRPTWRFGTRSSFEPPRWHDPFGIFGDAGVSGDAPHSTARPASTRQRMMAVLRLEEGFTLVELKRRYKTLAKEHHPDLHGGDKAAEERLKLVIEAYRYLLDNRLYA